MALFLLVAITLFLYWLFKPSPPRSRRRSGRPPKAKLVNRRYQPNEDPIHYFRGDENPSKSITSSIDVPSPLGLQYFPYQLAGIEFLTKNKHVLLADEMGLGKTIQVIGYINQSATTKKVLIICPKSLKFNWAREIEKWHIHDTHLQIGVKYFELLKFGMGPHITVVSYEEVKKWHEDLANLEYDLMVFDEAHILKNSSTKKSYYCHIISRRSKKKILITGTPILNRPAEIWNLLQFLEPVTNYSKKTFNELYGFDYKNHQFSGDKLNRLNHYLRSTVMIRRYKKDVLPQLPNKLRSIIELEINPETKKALDAESEYLSKNNITFKDIAVEISGSPKKDVQFSKDIERVRGVKKLYFSEITKIRLHTAMSKVPQAIEFIQEILQENKKIVVFGYHKNVLLSIMSKFSNISVFYSGDSSEQERAKAEEEFKGPIKNIFFGTIGAAGVGINLTVSSVVIFVELDWTPAKLTQAEDRCHRIGQLDNVLIYHLVINGSIDSHIVNMLIEKQAMIEKITK